MTKTPQGQRKLVVLKIGLALPGRARERIAVGCEIEARVGGESATLASLELPPEDFGIPSTLDPSRTQHRGYEFRIPASLLTLLQKTIEKVALADRALWLHLATPYGYLGIVPWERLLVPRLGIAILRLPDLIAAPPTSPRTGVDVALCCSMPAQEVSFDTAGQLARMLARILQAIPAQSLVVHVFADMQLRAHLRRARLPRRQGARVLIHEPERAVGIREPCMQASRDPERLPNPWFLWMSEALAGQSIDIVHFLCHSHLCGERGALVLGQSPVREADPGTARFVNISEIDIFLTQSGARACVFSSPAQNFSEMGLRMLADTLARLRPLSVLHHDAGLDPDGGALGDAYRFLCATGSASPPVSPSLFIYCQPAGAAAIDDSPEPRLQGATTGTARDYARAGIRGSTGERAQPAGAALKAKVRPRTGVPGRAAEQAADPAPSWLAAGERFIEQQRLELQQAAIGNAGHGARATTKAVEATLEQMQAILARSARRHDGEPP